mmetsp:Transcript_22459/g.56763  ORF Transcript_22459/g.56763 Transcript_22459/m.56763 type:complete len:392 (+) Transcript_22459:251-1426(+)|eukprot:CAMPEP_0178995530 /NCGR_PEP_ID=MMETSP0795-20121207/7874_1 /TAXON_ID=88552 /ORGANISM="Amoebophrya sp., Strain Ameob2" /LENGTH=391 /DNA_ID=CAMNT_0020687839 /DNA_START=160 /DNA_END=1335 /DNA_ORIENTATION=+
MNKQSFLTGLDLEEPVYHTTSSSSEFKEIAAHEENKVFAYRVEDARLPLQDQSLVISLEKDNATGGSTVVPVFPLPQKLPLEKVKKNCAFNIEFGGAEQNRARAVWAGCFASPAADSIVADLFWWAICYYFKSGENVEEEDLLFDRISMNYVALFAGVKPDKRDFFFAHFADAIAQAVLYCLFLAYPKSRSHFGDTFRKDLLCRVSYWFTGFQPQFLSITHWKLNLGGGDVLKTAEKDPATASLAPLSIAAISPVDPNASSGPLKNRAPRVLRTLRHSPLLQHFLNQQKFTSANLVKALKMELSEAEDHVIQLDKKHAALPKQAAAATRVSEELLLGYERMSQELRKEEVQFAVKCRHAQQKVDQKKKEVLRKAPHEFANYLVSLKLLQTE